MKRYEQDEGWRVRTSRWAQRKAAPLQSIIKKRDEGFKVWVRWILVAASLLFLNRLVNNIQQYTACIDWSGVLRHDDVRPLDFLTSPRYHLGLPRYHLGRAAPPFTLIFHTSSSSFYYSIIRGGALRRPSVHPHLPSFVVIFVSLNNKGRRFAPPLRSPSSSIHRLLLVMLTSFLRQ